MEQPLKPVAQATCVLLFLLTNGLVSGQDRGTLAAPTEAGHSIRWWERLGGRPPVGPQPEQLPRPVPQSLSVPIDEPAITVRGNLLSSRREDAADVQIIHGDVVIQQGDTRWTGSKVVVWNAAGPQGGRIEFVFDGYDDQATRTTPAGSRPARGQLFTLTTNRPVVLDVKRTGGEISPDDIVVRRASETRAVAPQRRTAAQLPAPTELPVLPVQSAFPPPPVLPPIGGDTLFGMPPGLGFPGGGAQQRISITPRSFEVPFVLESRPNPNAMPAEQIITITRGVNIVIERPAEGDVLDLTADSAVIWTAASAGGSGGLGFNLDINQNTPFQVYLRGDIVLRTGGTIARASEAFFDRAEGRGLLLQTEVRQLVPSLRGDLRVNAETVRFEVTNPNLAGAGPSDLNLRATNAWVSGSRFGEPTYRLEAAEVLLDNRPTGRAINPQTGQIGPVSQPWITTLDNRFLLGNIPIARTPRVEFPAEEFTIPVRRLNVTADRAFGVQLQSTVSLNDLLNLPTPPGTRIDLNLDYFSERGPHIGPEWGYRFEHLALGRPALSYGFGEASYVYDNGEDLLGLGRRNLTPTQRNRGHIDLKHRTLFPDGWSATVEGGYISDRNFLEQYEEQTYDREKDLETLAEIKNVSDNLSVSALLQPQTNDFFNHTDWLPRADVTLLGQPVFQTPLVWSTHSMAGYGRINQTEPLPFSAAELAQNPSEVLDPLGYFADREGFVGMSRHELSLPFEVGVVNLAPYAIGEVLHQSESIDGDSLTRWYGAVGLRGSTSVTRIDRTVRNDILGLDGLAHKMTFDFDYSVAESSADLDEVSQYNEFDDNAQERFRERLTELSYGGVLPPTADPRGFALRSGAGRDVTAPYHELVDDQHVLRLGWRHRWQTKAGPPQNRRIRDWMTLDLESSIFPGAEDNTAEDNFGETLGLLSARWRWNLGERTAVLADGLYDPFDFGARTWSVGLLSQRSRRGSLYVGYRGIELGDMNSEIVSIAASYAMSEKWIAVAGTSFDFADGESRGNSLQVTRIGRDFQITYGVNYDASKNNFGASFQIEPLIGPRDGREIEPLLGRRPAQFGPVR